jgi:transposase
MGLGEGGRKRATAMLYLVGPPSHLNWREMLSRFCQRQSKHLYRVETVVGQPLTDEARLPVELRPRRVNLPLQQQRRQVRLELYHQVRQLSAKGMSKAEIARVLGISRGRVRVFVNAPEYPEVALPGPQPSMIDPYVPYLRRRWQEGCHNGLQLWREIVSQGYTGTHRLVSLLMTYLRKQEQQAAMASASKPHEKQEKLTPTQVSWLLLETANKQNQRDAELVVQLIEREPEFERVIGLNKRFRKMVWERSGEQELDGWMQDALTSGIAEVKGFVLNLRRDLPAVRAGLSLAWSNGQTEGQVNRLKLVKRQMYGRADFGLLRQRLLAA